MLANRFSSVIMIEKGNERVSCKSILGVISMGASYNSELTVSAVGDDSEDAIDAIVTLFESNFGES